MSEGRKIRVAITQGDANGVGLELIFRAFLDPEMLDLCTPIIYGSPKVASYHNKALNLRNQFSIINKVDDAKDGRVNLMVCTDEDIRVEFGRHSNEAALLAATALRAAVADCQQGGADVLVGGATDNCRVVADSREVALDSLLQQIIDPAGTSLRLWQTAALRITTASTGTISEVMSVVDKDSLTAKVKALDTTLRRDYRLDCPRIAVLALNLNDSNIEETVLTPVVQALAAAQVQVFGPYRSDYLFPSRAYTAFDAILALHYEQALLPLRMLTDEDEVVVQTNLPFVCTMLHCGAQMTIAGRARADATPLRHAIYAAIDMYRARQAYDAAQANPLPKLFKERSDSGERQ